MNMYTQIGFYFSAVMCIILPVWFRNELYGVLLKTAVDYRDNTDNCRAAVLLSCVLAPPMFVAAFTGMMLTYPIVVFAFATHVLMLCLSQPKPEPEPTPTPTLDELKAMYPEAFEDGANE